MTIAARRLAYSIAFVVFGLAAPLVVATTLGYRWLGWPGGFVRTGIVVIRSQPQANLFINGQARGATPRRVAGLTPGVYTLRLERTGYAPWQALVTLDPNSARVLGPVTLFPTEFTNSLVAEKLSQVMVDRDQTIMADVQTSGSAWTVRSVWPTNLAVSFELEQQPTNIVRSPRGQAWIFTTNLGMEVRLADRPEAGMKMVPAEALTWSQSSEQLFFGLRDGQLMRFDILTKTEEILGLATSLTASGETLWFTRKNDGTELWRQSALGRSTAVRVATIPGNWILQSGPSQRLWWQNSDTREAEMLSYNALTTALGRDPIGRLDQLFWQNAGQPPIWLDGVNLNTLANDRPVLLERSPNDYQDILWLDAPHLMLAVEPNRVTIKSVSTRQGHHQLMVQSLTASQTIVRVEPDQARLFVYDRLEQTLSQLRWDQPVANE